MSSNSNTGHNGRRRKTRANAGRTSAQSGPVTVTVHDPRTLQKAQELAAGRDVHIIGNPDGSVSIINGK